MNVWLDSGKLVCRRSRNLLLWPMDWLIGLLVGTLPRVATRLLCISAGMLVPVLWVVWFQWVGSLVVLLFAVCALVLGFGLFGSKSGNQTTLAWVFLEQTINRSYCRFI